MLYQLVLQFKSSTFYSIVRSEKLKLNFFLFQIPRINKLHGLEKCKL